MAKDKGKQFEEDIKNSFPDDFYIERYKDDTAGFYGVSNPADYRLYKYPLTFLLELKSHKGKSLPLSNIRNGQLKGMRKAIPHRGVYCGFIINYRDLEETYYIAFSDLVREFFTTDDKGDYVVKPDVRKSIPVDWCRDNGIKIEQVKKRTRYSYDMKTFLERYYDLL